MLAPSARALRLNAPYSVGAHRSSCMAETVNVRYPSVLGLCESAVVVIFEWGIGRDGQDFESG